ncbi:hypothetical protein C8R44DRAFT_136182 [Mycena epipterygia]|nr:hypothetical protein C8R44DRAFT_136182 [Mycena epipterygia]
METTGWCRLGCKDEEHRATCERINSWAEAQDSKNVYWLRGPARCDKSMVITLFDEFAEAHNLGGNFFEKDPALVLESLAAQLAAQYARHYSAHQGESWSAQQVRTPRGAVRGASALAAEAASAPEQVVFLFDGFEWCDHRKEAEKALEEQNTLQKVLRLLVEGSAQFPPNVRLLISSRTETEEVRDVLKGCERVVEHEMEPGLPEWEVRRPGGGGAYTFQYIHTIVGSH